MEETFSKGELIEYRLEFGSPWLTGTYHKQYLSLVEQSKREPSVSPFTFFFLYLNFLLLSDWRAIQSKFDLP